MGRLRSRLYNHLNITGDSENYSDEGPIDIDDQEELIRQFRVLQSSQSRQFINLLSILFLSSLPLYVFTPSIHQPVLCLCSILVLITSVINLRYVGSPGLFSGSLGDSLVQDILKNISVKQKDLVFGFSTNGLGIIILIVIWDDLKQNWRNLIFFVPLLVSVSTTISKYFITKDNKGISEEVDKLEGLKYKFKTI